MILKPFEYSSPHSLQEACKILEQHDDAKILAGGQSLLPIMKLNLTEITHLVDIKKIPNLSFIEISKDQKSLIRGRTDDPRGCCKIGCCQESASSSGRNRIIHRTSTC